MGYKAVDCPENPQKANDGTGLQTGLEIRRAVSFVDDIRSASCCLSPGGGRTDMSSNVSRAPEGRATVY